VLAHSLDRRFVVLWIEWMDTRSLSLLVASLAYYGVFVSFVALSDLSRIILSS